MIKNKLRRPEVAVGALVLSEDRVLLIKRGREPSKGLWALPGGRVHWGEKLSDAAEREVMEETNIAVQVSHIIYTFDSITASDDGTIDFHYVIVDFIAHPLQPNPQPIPGDDAADARWFTPAQLKTIPLSSATADLIAKHVTSIPPGNSPTI